MVKWFPSSPRNLQYNFQVGDQWRNDNCAFYPFDIYEEFHWNVLRKQEEAFHWQYTCRKICAGFGDRIRMIATMLYLSVVYNAHLTIHWTFPLSRAVDQSILHAFLPNSILWNTTDLPKSDFVMLSTGVIRFDYNYSFADPGVVHNDVVMRGEPPWLNKVHWGSMGGFKGSTVSSPLQVEGNLHPSEQQLRLIYDRIEFNSSAGPRPAELLQKKNAAAVAAQEPYHRRYGCPLHFAFSIAPPAYFLATEAVLRLFLPHEYARFLTNDPPVEDLAELVEIVMPRSEFSPRANGDSSRSFLAARLAKASQWLETKGIPPSSLLPSFVITLHFRTVQHRERRYTRYLNAIPLLECGVRMARALGKEREATFLVVTNNPGKVRGDLYNERKVDMFHKSHYHHNDTTSEMSERIPWDNVLIGGTEAVHSDRVSHDDGGLQIKLLMSDVLVMGSGDAFIAVASGMSGLAMALGFRDESTVASLSLKGECNIFDSGNGKNL